MSRREPAPQKQHFGFQNTSAARAALRALPTSSTHATLSATKFASSSLWKSPALFQYRNFLRFLLQHEYSKIKTLHLLRHPDTLTCLVRTSQ